MRGLRVVDAEPVEQHQRLLKAASAKHQVGLSSAGAALFQKNRRVLAQKILRRLGGKRFCFHRQNFHGALRLGQRHRRGRAQHNHGLSGALDLGCRRRRGTLRNGCTQKD